MSGVAIVHEWFSTMAGSERVVEELCGLYPEADIFSLYANADVVKRSQWLRERKLTTSFIQRMPGVTNHFRWYLPLMPVAIEQFDMSPYSLVLSSNHAVAKGVIIGPDQLHISYVHSPIRYAWDMQHQYLRQSGLDSGLKSAVIKLMLHRIRMWDRHAAAGVDHFVANSKFIARRIEKVYRRHADVIYPPVSVSAFTVSAAKEGFYLAASRLVPYKRMDLIVEAFSAMPQYRLVVVGDGPEMAKLRAKAKANVELLGYQHFTNLQDLMQRARAFIFAAEEDFGITPVEAQACGTPVIAFGKGGALETVDASGERPTGLFFGEQSVASICEAVDQFESCRDRFEPEQCRRNAERFSTERFRLEISKYIAGKLNDQNRVVIPSRSKSLFL